MLLRPIRSASSPGSAGAQSVVYFGRPQGVAAYFARLGHACPAGVNVADMVLDLVANEGKEGFGGVLGNCEAEDGGDEEKGSSTSRRESFEFADNNDARASGGSSLISFGSGRGPLLRSGGGGISLNRSMTQSQRRQQTGCVSCVKSRPRMLPCCYPSSTPSSCCWQLLVLLRLEGKVLFRSPGVAVVHSGVAVVMGLLLGFLYQSMENILSCSDIFFPHQKILAKIKPSLWKLDLDEIYEKCFFED